MGIFNRLTNSSNARNLWNSLKTGVSKVYTPIKKVVHGVSSISKGIDHLLDKATDYGVPATLVDLIRADPIYSSFQGGINFIDNLIEGDLPRLGSAVESLVEHNILGGTTEGLGSNLQNVRSAGSSLAQQASFGFTPNRGATSRQNITSAAS